jgi:hypothetical protein
VGSTHQSRHSFRWSLGRCRSWSLRTVGANLSSISASFVTATSELTYTPANAISLHRSLRWGCRLSPICIALHVGRSFPHVLSCPQCRGRNRSRAFHVPSDGMPPWPHRSCRQFRHSARSSAGVMSICVPHVRLRGHATLPRVPLCRVAAIARLPPRQHTLADRANSSS